MPRAATVFDSVEAKSTPLIYTWGALGIFFFLLQIYIFGSWILSEDFATVDPGPDTVPGYTANLTIFFQALNVVLALLCIRWGIRSCLREGRLTTSTIIIFAWLLTFWQDPMANYFRLIFTYNSHMVNFGSWANFIPGWVLPNGNKIAEPLIFNLGAYLSVIPLLCFFCAWLMRKAKTQWPGISKLGLVGVACVAMIIMDLLIEGLWVRTGCYSFSGTVHSWSLWGGEWYQFPLYNSILWGPVLATGGVLIYFRDDKGRVAVEQGSENISSPVKRTFLRFMAISAVFNVAFLAYNISMAIISFQMDATPELPSYLSNGICGPGTGYTCPGPEVHVPLPKSGYLIPR